MKSTNKRLDELTRAMAGLGRGDAGGRALSADTIIERARAVLAKAEPNDERAESHFRAIDSLLRHTASATRRATI